MNKALAFILGHNIKNQLHANHGTLIPRRELFWTFPFSSFPTVALSPCCATTCSQRTEYGLSFTHLTSRDTFEWDPKSFTHSFLTYQQTESTKSQLLPSPHIPSINHATWWLLRLSITGYRCLTSTLVTYFWTLELFVSSFSKAGTLVLLCVCF